MKKIILSVGLLIAQLGLQAQCPEWNLRAQGKSHRDFVPQGGFLLDSVQTDFNADGIPDWILVLASSTEQGDDATGAMCERSLVILQGSKGGYTLQSHNKKAIMCRECGGVFGDPFSGIKVNKNVMHINHYGGSSTRWVRKHTFRFQNNEWMLIGVSESNNSVVLECATIEQAELNLTEVNFNTAKMHVVRTKRGACKPYKDQWIPYTKKPLISLKAFDIEESYFPLKVD